MASPPNNEDVLPPLQLQPHVTMAVDPTAREAPYWVRGRNHEIAHIVRGFAKLPRAITVIAGAPGTGKSTLLHHIQVYAAKLGMHVIRLKGDDFETHATLADAIRGVRSGLRTAPDHTERSAEAAAKAGIPFIGEASGGGRLSVGTSGPRPGTWREALNEIGMRRARGVLFTLDETQRMAVHLADSERATRAQQFMDEIHSESAMHDKRPVTLVCAGLSDSPTVLNNFGMTRIENNHTLRLGALSPAAGYQILQDHITAPTEDGNALIAPPEDLINSLVADCGGCAHHLAWAGWRLQEQALLLELDGLVTWSDDVNDSVRERVRGDRAGLYRNRMPKHTDKPYHEAACVLALATERYGEQLPERKVVQITDAIAKRNDQRDGNDILAQLTRKGVIEYRTAEDRFLTKVTTNGGNPHYVFPVHSMATWVNQSLQANADAKWQRTDSERELTSLFGEPPDQPPENGWDWDDSKPILPLPTKARLPEGTSTKLDGISIPALANPDSLTPEVRKVLQTSEASIVKHLFADVGSGAGGVVPNEPVESEAEIAPQDSKSPDDG